MTRETRTQRVETAATMVRVHGVSITAAAAVMRVDVSEVRIALGMDRSMRGAAWVS